jgi:hypothetical protein
LLWLLRRWGSREPLAQAGLILHSS